MCGIAGIVSRSGTIELEYVRRMTALLRHRGPDGEGFAVFPTASAAPFLYGGPDTPQEVWESDLAYTPRPTHGGEQRGQLLLGHRRLAILDPTPSGHQPMCDPTGRYWIVYNGEIYNFEEIRSDLAARGHCFMSDNDTEVLLRAYAEWGEKCLERLNGMWGFVVYDVVAKRLFAARDRFGVKPLYFTATSEVFGFASEIKPLLASGVVSRRVNEDRLYDYLVHALTDHTCDTFFQGVQQLPAGHYLVLDIERWGVSTSCYYRLAPVEARQQINDRDQAALGVRTLLTDAVRLRMVSDVPLGVTLSGGLDSTAVACLKHIVADSNVRCPDHQKTFSILYGEESYDETPYIDEIVQQIGSHHEYGQVSGATLAEDLTKMLWHLEEPVGKVGVYSQWQVFRMVARAGVKVTLDGQGGDEVFGGYHGYYHDYYRQLLRRGRVGRWSYELGCLALKQGFAKLLPHLPSPADIQNRIGRRAGRSATTDDPPFAWLSRDFWRRHRNPEATAPRGAQMSGFDALTASTFRSLTVVTLPTSLRISDRNSMAHSVESRMPFLDYRLVEYGYGLPDSMKIHNAQTKFVLREAMRGILPERVRTRQDKTGFWMVQSEWLRQPNLKGILTELAGSSSLKARPYFNGAACGDDLVALVERGEYHASWRWANAELWLREFIDSK
jgi:asparagine synthase (glutamine-hydrolysing)